MNRMCFNLERVGHIFIISEIISKHQHQPTFLRIQKEYSELCSPNAYKQAPENRQTQTPTVRPTENQNIEQLKCEKHIPNIKLIKLVWVS